MLNTSNWRLLAGVNFAVHGPEKLTCATDDIRCVTNHLVTPPQISCAEVVFSVELWSSARNVIKLT